jgi:hypothetical protein
MKTINNPVMNIELYSDMTGACASAAAAEAFRDRLHEMTITFIAETAGKSVDEVEDDLAGDLSDARSQFVSLIELGSEAVLSRVLGI